ncbi:Sister chromatid cohesion protein 2 [Tilletia horrida]|nr:Sister chromatid cohesion protein 2 [Tilletia horrida]
MRGGVSGTSSGMLALQRREHSFHNHHSGNALQPPMPSIQQQQQQQQRRAHTLHMPVQHQLRTPVVVRAGGAATAPPSPESSGSNSSIKSGIHVFRAPPRAGVGNARRLPQFTMQPTPRSRTTAVSPRASQPQRLGTRTPTPVKPGQGRFSLPSKGSSSNRQHHSHRMTLTTQHVSQQQRVPVSKRPKKLLSSVMSATNFYSSSVPAPVAQQRELQHQQDEERDVPRIQPRPFSFTFGATTEGVPRAIATPPSPGGSPDPIDAFSSPIPLRPLHLQATLKQTDDGDDQDHLLGIFADMQKTVAAAPAAPSRKRSLAQLFDSDDSDDDEPIMKPDAEYIRSKQQASATSQPRRTAAPDASSSATSSAKQQEAPHTGKENDAPQPASQAKSKKVKPDVSTQSRKRPRQEDGQPEKRRKSEPAQAVERKLASASSDPSSVTVGPSRSTAKPARRSEPAASKKSGKDAPPPAKKAKKNSAAASGKVNAQPEVQKGPQQVVTAAKKEAKTAKGKGKQKADEDLGADKGPSRSSKRIKPAQVTSVDPKPQSSEPAPAVSTSSRPQRNVKRKQIIEITDDEDETDEEEEREEDDDFGEAEVLNKVLQPAAKKDKKAKAASARPKRTAQNKKAAKMDEEKGGERREEEEEDMWEATASSNPVLQLLEADEEDGYEARVQQRLSSGKAKGVDNRSPVRRLVDLMAEIFDGEDGLPPTASGIVGLCAESALVFTQLQGHFVLRMDVLHSLGRLIKLCKSTPPAPILPSAATATAPSSSSAGEADPAAADASASTSEPEPRTVAEIDPIELSRLLRVLERTVRAADGTRPFADTRAGQTKKAAAESSSDDAASLDMEDSSDQPSTSESATDQKDGGGQYGELSQRIERIAGGVLAAECCLEIFSVDKLPETLVSEDILQSCLDALKLAVNETILPFVEGCADLKTTSTQPLLRHFLQNLIPAPLKKKRGRPSKSKITDAKSITAITGCGNQVTSVFVRTYAALGALHSLVNVASVQLSESVIISVIYVALGPFFAIEPEEVGAKGKGQGLKEKKAGGNARTAIDAVGGASAMRSLRLPALHLLRSIFARHPEQRSWIIEEVLGSMGKLSGTKKMARQIALRSGGSVNFLTTLLLHLVQSSAHGFREHVLAKEPVNPLSVSSSPIKSPVSTRSEGSGGSKKRKRSESPVKAGGGSRKAGQAAMWSMSMEGPLQTASTISAFMMQRVAAGKASRSSNDTAYVAIVEGLMLDLLEMLFLPEWPGAGILLTRFCISFISVLNDPQAGPEARGVAIDQLGAAAARLRSCQLQLGGATTSVASSAGAPLRLLRDIINDTGELNSEALEQLQISYVTLRNSLGRITDEDRAADSARELLEAQWIAETAAAMTKLNDDPQGGPVNGQSAEDQEALEALVDELKLAPKKVGKDLPRSDEITPTQYKELMRTSHFVLSSSAFMVQYETLQSHLLDALERQAVANRAKALRALSGVAAIDSELLVNEEVRWAVEARLEDASVGVREAAVGLLSRYILQRPKEIAIHFEQLVHHIYDSGVSVRKRIIRLLADIYNAVSDKDMQAECCVRLMRCVTDEDTGVQDLAVAIIARLWFDVSLRASESKKGKLVAVNEGEDNNGGKASPAPSASASGSAYSRHADVIIMVASMIRERPSPMEEVFSRLLQQCSEQDANKLRASYRELSDSMIDAIVSEPTGSSQSPNPAAAEHDPASMFSRMKTIHLLVSTLPTVLTVNRGKALLPFLKSAQTDTEMQVLHLLLRVFSAALPSMPRTAIAFAQELERSLMPLINRPRFKSGSTALQELVGCYVKVIKLHTHNFSMMLKMFTQCFGRLQFVADHVSVAPKLQLEATNAILIALTTLLCEHADFDKLRQTHPALAPVVNNLTKGSVLEGVYTMLVTIYQSEDSGYKAAALQSLGWLFRSYPSLMGRDDATRTMDEVLGQGDAQQRELLLRSLLEFLNGQQQTRSEEMAASKQNRSSGAQSVPVDMAQLVGDTAEFAESSVSSALLQRYLDRILEASLSVRMPSLQRTALEILKITVLQGLTHPLQCVPTLIALETSADENVRSAAFHMHSHLAMKHGSILAARYLDHARVAFSFQLSIKGADQLRGLRMEERPTAALQQWYSLVAEKRQTKLDFLKALVKAFDIGRLEAACTREDVAFARFLADNLALFEYSTNEEVMTIVGELRAILSVAGMQTYAAIDDELEERETELQNFSQGSQKKAPEMWIEIEVTNTRPKRTQAATNGSSTRTADQQTSQGSDKILDKARELELARTSTILSFALVLRNQLKWLYTLSEARCAKYVPGKKGSAGADKPAVRRTLTGPTAAVLELGSFPGAFSSCEQSRDALLQMQAFHNAIAEEGSILEADEDDDYE